MKPSILSYALLMARSALKSWLGVPLVVSPNLLRFYGADIGRRVFAEGLSVEERFARLLTIEDDVVLAYGCHIILHDSALNNLVDAPVKFGRVIIRQGAYIGARSTILPGVEIGQRALIGACSLVTHSIPPEVVAYGVPARPRCTLAEFVQSHSDQVQECGPLVAYMSSAPWRQRRGLLFRVRQYQTHARFLDDFLLNK